jgi:hypothetical protein
MVFLLEQQAHFNESLYRLTKYQTESEERHTREMASQRAHLKCAIQLSVEEARRDRGHRREMYTELKDSLSEVGAMQKVTEAKLQRLIDHRNR